MLKIHQIGCLLTCFAWFVLMISCTHPAPETCLVPIAEGYSETSVNTAIFRNAPLATFDGEQFVCYYDAEGYLVLGKRSLDSREWTLQRSNYKARVEDAHNVACLAVDGEGYLHLAFDHHDNALNYCRSVQPRSLELGACQQMTGCDEDRVTYPEFYRLPGGDLLFAYRSGASGRGNLVMNRYSVAENIWKRVQDVLIDGEEMRNAYWQLCVDGKGTIHLSWVWRETWMVETNHDLCYARSLDGGESWQKSDGQPYELPLRMETAEVACYIPQGSELINQTSMAADEAGNPYIATYWRDEDGQVPQYRLVWHDGEKWQVQIPFQRNTPFSLKGGGTKMIPIARPRLLADNGEIYYFFRDEERGSRVSMAYTDDLASGIWQVEELTDFAVGAWEPTFDAQLWNQSKRIHLFVQASRQGDGEQKVSGTNETIYVMEIKR